MKTRYALLYILTVLLSICSIQTSHAQAKQDALYIFRNDGQFNAFFFGDIDRIEYSKIDTLGVEQADYVVQEVWALDTVCRIPISAIDSVAFVTPENKIKADVFCPDKSIANYIVASDTINWIRLASNTPDAMIPKVGDKLLIEEQSKYIPGGFVGKVTSVEKGSNGYTVMTGELKPSDVYDRFVLKAAAATPQSGPARRRGLIDGTEMSYTTEEPIELPAVGGSFTIQGSRVLYDEHDISLTADGAGTFSFSVAPRMEYRGFVFFDPELGFQQDHNTIIYNTTSWGLSLSGSLTGNIDIPLKGLPEKNLAGGLKLAVSCGLFVNAQVTGITVQANWESEQISRNYLVQRVDPPFIFQDNEPINKSNITFLRDTMTISGSVQGKYTFSAGVYAKAEISSSLPYKKTSKYENKIGARVEVGGRLSFEAPVWTPDVVADLLTTPSIYQLLNKDTNISVSAYGKLSAYAQFDDWSWGPSPEISTVPAHLYGLVPDISDIKVSFDDPERVYRYKFTSPIRRDVLFGVPTGFVVLDQDKKVIDDWGGGYHFREKQGKSYDHVFTTLDPIRDDYKTYTVYPYIKYLNSQLLVDKSKDVKVDPARIEIEQRKIKVSGERGSKEVTVRPNMAKVEFTPTSSWLETIWIDSRNELNVFWGEMPEGMKGRKAKINIKGINSTTNETIITDTIAVLQGEPDGYANVDPTLLEFPAEGGALFYTVDWGDYQYLRRVASDYLVNTELKSARGQDYVSPERYNRDYYVTAPPNNTNKAMSDTVFCYFTNDKESPLSERYCIPVVIKQAAGPYDLQSIRKFFVGSWIGISYLNDKPHWERRVIFYDDGTFNSQDRFVNTKTGEWGAWSKLEKQTYSVESVTTSSLYYRVYINLTGYGSGQFVELYPHFMRHGGFYYEREDGTGDIWWKARTRSEGRQFDFLKEFRNQDQPIKLQVPFDETE